MSTYNELIYMILDELKGEVDDFTFNQDHIEYLISKFRAFLIKKEYDNIKKLIPEANYQTICLDLELAPAFCGEPCTGDDYLRSTTKIPFMMSVGTPKAFPVDYYLGEISFVSKERMKYVGYNKYLRNIIYASIGPDGYLYFKSSNPLFKYLKKVKVQGLFEDIRLAARLSCPDCNCDEKTEHPCEDGDLPFPMEESLFPSLLELVKKELLQVSRISNDNKNNAKDDLAKIG